MKAIKKYNRLFKSLTILFCSLILLTACSIPQVSAEDRMFVDLSLNFLEKYELSIPIISDDQPVNQLSSLTYQVPGYGTSTDSKIQFYGLSDAVTAESPAKFYTFNFNLDPSESIPLKDITIEGFTQLKDKQDQPLLENQVYPESIAFSPRNSVFIATENLENINTPPLIAEYDLKTGQLKNTVPLSPFYLPQFNESEQTQGVEPQFGFKGLTISPDGFSPDGRDPFRLFTVTEKPLIQDRDSEQATKLRLLHYVIADRASFLVSETLYLLDETSQRLVDIAAAKGGILLSLEQSKDTGKIYQLFTGDATDTSRMVSLQGDLIKVQPVRKKLLLDLKDLGIPLQQLSGMTLGSRLPDGSQSLVILNQQDDRTQFLLLSLKQS
ncbi:esterase-like activity of phytase family protein [Planktothrix sp. FACHB-1365]|uniref:esterase-like activity of phytase family protein n=1 Tax=Planktothrix sp. FACHB-1365 TaxID=2692855 RepID=UPI001F54A14B|nr:esterase-like activity of phytase family protein [Planktothrix sp. FACHB-1365]